MPAREKPTYRLYRSMPARTPRSRQLRRPENEQILTVVAIHSVARNTCVAPSRGSPRDSLCSPILRCGTCAVHYVITRVQEDSSLGQAKWFNCMRAGGHSLFIASNATYTQQIYGATAIKSGHIIAWKAIMAIEVAGQRKQALMQNKSK